MGDDADRLSPANINFYRWEVAQGTATPEDARRLLREFVRQAPAMRDYLSHARNGDQQGWQYLVEHLAACITAFVDGRKVLEKLGPADEAITIQTKTLDKAFGLVGTQAGRRKIVADEEAMVAAQILRELLRGQLYKDAESTVSRERRRAGHSVTAKTHIRRVWRERKADGLLTLRLMRAQDGESWTENEMVRLKKIYRDVRGAPLPGHVPNK